MLEARHRDKLAVEAVCFAHIMRSRQCREKLSDVPLAARRHRDVRQALERSIFPGQLVGGHISMVRALLCIFSHVTQAHPLAIVLEEFQYTSHPFIIDMSTSSYFSIAGG